MVRIENQWVEFSFFRPEAEKVSVAGDFNNWKIGDIELCKCKNGYWRTKVKIPAGEYKFRYCADGQWFTDYAANGIEPGRFGMNSIIIVQKAQAVEPELADNSEQAEKIAVH